MDGLECSEVKLSQVIKSERSFRTDAEFYQKAYINMQKELFLKKSERLKAHTKKIDVGFVGAMVEEFTEDINDPILLQTKNVKEFFVDTTNCIHINTAFHLQLRKSQIHKEDVLIARSGSFGKASIFLDDGDTNSSDIIIVETNKDLNPFYLTTFLNSRLGRMQLYRFASGGLQGHVNLTILENLMVPLLEDSFQRRIERLVRLASVKVKQAEALYNKAEVLLSSSLSLKADTYRTQSISIKNLDESFSISGRLDAEYYQPKYDELFSSLSKQSIQPLGGKDGIVTINKSIEPGSDAYCDEGISFVRVSDITKYGISEPSIKLPSNVVPNVASLYPQKDTILFSKDGSVGIAYKIEKDLDIITSGALLHLTVKNSEEVLPDYLTLVLNSKVVQLQAERDSSGAIIKHWKPSEIEKVVIPVLDLETQKQISEKVQESFALRHQSEELLEYAKRTVEIAIEEGEKKAMEWLKAKGVEC